MPSQDNPYHMHVAPMPGMFNNSTNTNLHLPSEISGEYDSQKHPHVTTGKLNGIHNPNYSREQFNNFPNTNRPRQSQTLFNSTTPSFREPGSYFPSNHNDIYSSGLMSPTSTHMQPHGPGNAYDVGRTQGLGGGHRNFSDHPFNNSVGMMPSHQAPSKPSFSHPTFSPGAPYINTMHSQTPYGPHVPTNISQPTSNPTTSNTNPSSYGSNKDSSSSQEEISTIFVVGFPEDMQEREFQNMFTFSSDFEAATLKIPNKEYTAYNGMGAGRNFQNYNGHSDPYNIMTLNSGGVIVDSREGMSSWPASVPGEDGSSHFMPGVAPPRKQIIGFAKFKSRDAAIEARDVLQGRRIDIEKGAILKAEMAKKNLHTKRGVGPLPNNAVPSNGNNIPNFGIPPNESIFSREREPLATVGRLGQWKDSAQPEGPTLGNVGLGHIASPPLRERDEDERRREDVLNAMGFGMTRGPRERAAEEEKRKERLRVSNVAAYDAFHSVSVAAPPGLSRQSSTMNGLNGGNSLYPPESDSGPSTSLISSPSSSYGQQGHLLQSGNEVVGPWDRVNRAIPARPSSRSQRSSSPIPAFSASPSDMQDSLSANLQTPRNDDNQSSLHFVSSASDDTGSMGGNGIRSPESTQSDLSRKVDSLALNTANGNISPQLPSPASGASSGSTRNAVDQNPPINTLYVGNLPTSPPPIGMPQDHLEESLRELFRNQPGYRRLCFRQKHNGPMCFVEFEDVGFAARAMSDLHGNNLKGLVKGGGIRLSYSKNPLGVRTPTSANSSGPALQQQQLHNMQAVLNSEVDSPPQHRTILRRDEQAGSAYNSFHASPPPRFLPSQPGGAGFFGPSSPTASAAASFMRPPNGSLNAFSYSLAAANGVGAPSISPTPFSPFASKDQHDTSIPDQSAASEEALHPQQ
ncbi:hypothetical protein AGABI2DRAFT_188573 [Agaricus bisporus var. bisporus H97]|uniref:hypothetical protein n=1 Tax=Agaricus bisporus var. bisporus (strain H97 / ATCC MYA-4626 / FGSC 10389) TaxID=936046 RepID=UPI00029F5871|nr:hypothetical protein AGABI2DRAFT_188573 [Agaricus bisporus var. bisporus H97]EKV42404.1 hypothetical protein AGABI2DRAFT_188573 [Agaricus bisporus var. bisporus H97]